MAKSRPGRKPMRKVPRHQVQVRQMAAQASKPVLQTKAPMADVHHFPLPPRTRPAAAPTVALHKPALEPSKIKNVMSWRKKTGIFAGASAATGGTAYLYHHSRRSNVKKFYDPFDDQVVEFGKDRDHKAGLKRGAKIGAGLAGVNAALGVPAGVNAVRQGMKPAQLAASHGIVAGTLIGTGGLVGAAIGTKRKRVKKSLLRANPVKMVNMAERLAGQTGKATSADRKALGRAEPQGELSRRLNERRSGMAKFYDPFVDDVVTIEKAFSPTGQGYAVTNVRISNALVPTGRHVSRANDVSLTRRGRRSGNTSQKLLHVRQK